MKSEQNLLIPEEASCSKWRCHRRSIFYLQVLVYPTWTRAMSQLELGRTQIISFNAGAETNSRNRLRDIADETLKVLENGSYLLPNSDDVYNLGTQIEA